MSFLRMHGLKLNKMSREIIARNSVIKDSSHFPTESYTSYDLDSKGLSLHHKVKVEIIVLSSTNFDNLHRLADSTLWRIELHPNPNSPGTELPTSHSLSTKIQQIPQWKARHSMTLL